MSLKQAMKAAQAAAGRFYSVFNSKLLGSGRVGPEPHGPCRHTRRVAMLLRRRCDLRLGWPLFSPAYVAAALQDLLSSGMPRYAMICNLGTQRRRMLLAFVQTVAWRKR